jgi:hypothetical protein
MSRSPIPDLPADDVSANLLIRDVRWAFPKQLGAIIASRQRKHPKIPSIAVMLEARKVAVPADYESSEIGEITFISRIK